MSYTNKTIHAIWISYKSVWKINKSGLIIILLSKIILGLLPLASIWLLENLIDEISLAVESYGFTLYILLFLIGIALVTFLSFALNKFSEITKKYLTYKFDLNMKGRILEEARNVPYLEFESSTFQNKLVRALTGQKSMINLVDSSTTLLQTILSLFSILGYLIHVSVLFGILLFTLVIPIAVLDIIHGKQRFYLSKELVEKSRKEAYYESLLSNRESVKEIRINKLEIFFINQWKELFEENQKDRIKQEIKQTKWLVLINTILLVSFILSGGYVIYLMQKASLTIGVLAAVLQAVQRLQGIIPSFTNTLSNLYEFSLHVQEFHGFFPGNPVQQLKKNEIKTINSIEAINLTFSYSGQAEPTIQNINLEVSHRKKIAIIGGNGAGKSTLIKCLSGLYETANMIKINRDFDISEIDRENYRSRLSVLFQDFNKYEMEVLVNIASSDIDSINNTEKIIKYAKEMDIHSYIETLPKKYHANLGRLFKNSHELSGGQWQKLAIARALFKGGDMIFLDEPTSALDPESEYTIVKNLLKVVKDMGVIYITHRLNVAMLADEILIMDKGRIVERGSHEELLNNRGVYYEIYVKQVDQITNRKGGAYVS